MRKLIAFTLFFLFAFSASVMAESVDLTTMTTDELLAFRERLNAEINDRLGDDKSLIVDGVYVAGVDIKPGMYRISCVAAFDDREFIVNLFESKENYQIYDKSRWSNASYRLSQAPLLVGGTTIVNLTEGVTIEIYNGIGRMEAVQPDWAL